MRQDILLQLLARAAAEPLGLVIETNNPKAMRENYLQNLRKDHPDPNIRNLIFAIPSVPNTLFICQPTVDLEAEPEIEE
jgi:hypothetical protein